MTNFEIAQLRLQNQHIARQIFNKPAEIVDYMGAVQAQDYAAAKWALGLRLQNSSDAKIDKALDEGNIIRTHVLRPTWHFVTLADVSAMIDLTAARIKAMGASQYRQLALDKHVFNKANDVLAATLQGNKQIARPELAKVLADAGIATNEQRLIHLLMNAELDKVICSGGRQGKQFSYALFDDRVPRSQPFIKEETLARLALKYFTSRGPATINDFAWWAGITITDAKTGLEPVKKELTTIKSDGGDHWMSRELPDNQGRASVAHLLPAFDEFAVAYADRSACVHPRYWPQPPFVVLGPVIVVNGQIVGSWKRVLTKGKAEISLEPFGALSKAHISAVEAANKKYQRFVT